MPMNPVAFNSSICQHSFNLDFVQPSCTTFFTDLSLVHREKSKPETDYVVSCKSRL